LHVCESFWDFFGMDTGAETFGLQPDGAQHRWGTQSPQGCERCL
jgi:hypothetical protein